MIQLQELPEGEGIDHELHIPSAQIGSQFTGEQPGIGTGEIDVTVQSHPQGIDTLLPVLHLLDLIKEQIHLAGDSLCPAENLLVKCPCIQQMGIAQILKVIGDQLLFPYTRSK